MAFKHRVRYRELFGDLAIDAAAKAGEIKPGCDVTIDSDFATHKEAKPWGMLNSSSVT